MFFGNPFTTSPICEHVNASGENLPCIGYLVYGPHATGHDRPFFSAPLGGQYLPSASVDASGNLYVVDTATNAAERYTTPLSHPTLDASFDLGIGPNTLVADFVGRMFVNYNDTQDDGNIARFPAGAPNQSQPSNSFRLSNGILAIAIATRGQYGLRVQHGSW